jgi:hypothetical protein
MSQLKSDEQVVGGASERAVPLKKGRSQSREVAFGVWIRTELLGVRACFGDDGVGLSAPYEFGAALAKACPATMDEVGRSTVWRSVPSFHRKNGESIADSVSCDLNGCGERSFHLEFLIDGEIDPELFLPSREFLEGF